MSYIVVEQRLKPEAIQFTTTNLELTKGQVAINSLGNPDQYDSIVKRPLFIEARKFEEEKKAVAKARPVPVRQDLKLLALGVAVSGEGILAVVKSLKTGKISRLNIGEQIEGWELKSVSGDRFTFTRDTRKKVINYQH
jgi:hypothetical protein